MSPKKLWLFVILFLFTLCLYACDDWSVTLLPPIEYSTPSLTPNLLTTPGTIVSTSDQPTTLPIFDGCIAPLETFAYSIATDPEKPSYPGNGPKVLPPSPWQVDTSLPSDYMFLVARSVQGATEIWAKRNPYSSSDVKIQEFMVYKPETKTWMNVSAKVGSSTGYVGKLFVTKDGSLWGQIFWDALIDSTGRHTITGQPVLARFSENTQQFEFEYGTEQFSYAWMDPSKTPYGSEILVDSQGIFWFLVHKDAIYSYDPVTKTINKYADIPDHIVSDPELAPDGSIYYINDYYLEHGVTLTIQDEEIFHFLPETGKPEKIPIPLEPWPVFSDILVDRSGRLWLDSLGWREPDGKWYQIHRSPLFVTNVLWSGMEYRWKTPQILVESWDGRLWFRSDNGMIWLDPQKGEWCWFTTEQSDIVEDQEHNLWIVADNRLYKLSLNP